jgi:hypothetical protein
MELLWQAATFALRATWQISLHCWRLAIPTVMVTRLAFWFHSLPLPVVTTNTDVSTHSRSYEILVTNGAHLNRAQQIRWQSCISFIVMLPFNLVS